MRPSLAESPVPVAGWALMVVRTGQADVVMPAEFRRGQVARLSAVAGAAALVREALQPVAPRA